MKNKFKLLLTGLLLTQTTIGFSSLVFAKTKKNNSAPSNSESTTLRNRIQELEQNQKILERKWEVEQEKAEQKEKDKPKDSATAGVNSKDGFYLKNSDGSFILKFKALLQADARFFLKDKTNATDQFIARRVRPILEGDLSKYFSFKIMPDFGGGTTVLQDAYADIKPLKELKIRAGKFKVPVGLERLQSGANLFSIERGLPTGLVPNRDIGFMLHGDIANGFLQYAVGAFNGTTDGGIIDGDTSDGKEIAGRLFFQPFKNTNLYPVSKLGVGVSGTYGKQFGSTSSTGLPTYRSIGQNSFFSYRSTGTAATTSVANGKRYRLSPQGYFYYGPFGLFGEYVISSQKVSLASSSKSLKNNSWQIAASYVLTGEENSFSGFKVKKPVNFKKGNWGAIELGARYNDLDIDNDAFPIYADPSAAASRARSWGLVANWYLTDNFKWSTSFDQTRFTGGAAASSNRPKENALFTRLQIAY